MDSGFYILLEPLPPGSHEIHFKVALGDPTAICTMNFELDVRYLLTVVGGQTEMVTPTVPSQIHSAALDRFLKI